MKNKALITAMFLSSICFAKDKNVEYVLKTEAQVNSSISQKSSDNKIGYNFKIFDFDVKFKKEGFNVGTVLKSSRSNLLLDDWDNDAKNSFEFKKREKDHDFMAKIYINYEPKEFHGLKSKSSFTYYIDNPFNKDKLAEYVEDDGTKQLLGNTIFHTNLKGTLSKTKTELDLDFKYKANNFFIFDKDESYLKTNINITQPISKNTKLSLKHNFDFDLYHSNIKFDAFDNHLDEYPDYILGHYLYFFKQEANVGLKHLIGDTKEAKEYFDIQANVKVDSQLLRGTTKNSKITTPYNIIDPSINISLSKKIYGNWYVTPKIENVFIIKYAQFLPETSRQKYNYDLMAAYLPKFNLGITYDRSFGENKKLKSETGLGYGLSINIAPYFSKTDKFKHSLIVYNKTNFEYKASEKLNLKLNTDLSFNAVFTKDGLLPATDKLDVDFNAEYKHNEKLEFNSKLENKLSFKNFKKVLNPDTITDELKAELGVKYKINKQLTFDLKTYAKFKGEFNQLLKPKYNSPESLKTKLLYFGDTEVLALQTTLGLDTKLNYEKKLNDKLNLKLGLDVNTKLDLLSVRSSKVFHFDKNNIPEGKMKPEIRDIRHKSYNIGGSVVVNPSVGVNYKLKDNFTVNASVNVKTKFARDVINIVDDKNRPDNGQYWYIDKKFEFKEVRPTVKVGFEFKW